MQFRKILLNLAVALSALLFGLAWVGIFQFFVERTVKPQPDILLERVENKSFDINNPESVLPIDFEENKLSDPKEDESNPEYFDPEGTYFVLDKLPEEFSRFEAFVINNKTLKFDETGSYTVENTSPEGYVYDYKKYEFENIEIRDGKIKFQTKDDGILRFGFEGEFLVKGNFYTMNPNARVVKGTLTKIMYDKKLRVNDVTFGWMIDFE